MKKVEAPLGLRLVAETPEEGLDFSPSSGVRLGLVDLRRLGMTEQQRASRDTPPTGCVRPAVAPPDVDPEDD